MILWESVVLDLRRGSSFRVGHGVGKDLVNNVNDTVGD